MIIQKKIIIKIILLNFFITSFCESAWLFGGKSRLVESRLNARPGDLSSGTAVTFIGATRSGQELNVLFRRAEGGPNGSPRESLIQKFVSDAGVPLTVIIVRDKGSLALLNNEYGEIIFGQEYVARGRALIPVKK